MNDEIRNIHKITADINYIRNVNNFTNRYEHFEIDSILALKNNTPFLHFLSSDDLALKFVCVCNSFIFFLYHRITNKNQNYFPKDPALRFMTI